MHPSYLVPRIYRALVDGSPTEAELEALRSGKLIISGKPAAPALATMLRGGPDDGWLELTLTEGRRHQVNLMCAGIGHPIKRLKRVAYCDLWLPKDLAPGRTRQLSPQQVNHLRAKVGLGPLEG